MGKIDETMEEIREDFRKSNGIIIIDKDNQDGWKNKEGHEDDSIIWKDFWKEHAKRKSLDDCCRLGCTEKAEHGSHVLNSKYTDSKKVEKEWIVPLCRICNHYTKEETFKLNIGTILVDASKTETCKKKEALDEAKEN